MTQSAKSRSAAKRAPKTRRHPERARQAILKAAQTTFKRLHGEEPKPKAIHAGLECGIIGDKFPAPAIVLLAELINRKHDLVGAIDASITGQRVEIEADDKRKQSIMKAMEKQVGMQVMIGGKPYKINDYRDNQGLLDIISLSTERSISFARPSGTGNSVRIYIFGDRVSGKKELENIAGYLKSV